MSVEVCRVLGKPWRDMEILQVNRYIELWNRFSRISHSFSRIGNSHPQIRRIAIRSLVLQKCYSKVREKRIAQFDITIYLCYFF